MRPSPSQVSGRAILAKAVVHMEDALADPDYDHAFAHAGGWRRMLGVPMLREGSPIGVIVAGWAETGPIPKAQEELLRTFADQAVIAIENVRLFNETKEALERQTATSEVLQVISESPTDVQPVFDIIAERAARLTGAESGMVYRFDGEWIHLASSYGIASEIMDEHPDAAADAGRCAVHLGRGNTRRRRDQRAGPAGTGDRGGRHSGGNEGGRRGGRGCAAASPCPCSATGRWSARSRCTAASPGASPTTRSTCCEPSPARR